MSKKNRKKFKAPHHHKKGLEHFNTVLLIAVIMIILGVMIAPIN